MSNIFTQNASKKTMSLVITTGLLVFLPLLLYASYQTVILLSRASGKPANIVVHTQQQLGPINTDFFHAFSQGGEEPSDMLLPIKDEIAELKPKYIRLDHIYDHHQVVKRHDDGSLSFDFSNLDKSVNTILEVGAKPLLVLSFMPADIAQNGSIINPPNDWNEWAFVVQKTIEHFSGINNRNIENIYYEVWNEPDLDQFGKWYYSGNKNYLTLYTYAAKGADSAKDVNKFFIGGPSTTGLYKNWIMALVELAQTGVRLDFLSWHSYYNTPDLLQTEKNNLISWLVPYPKYVLLPTLITELGFTGSKDARYGTKYAAAFTAAAVRQMITGGPKYVFTFQPIDGPNQESGDGWGLITHGTNGLQKKPRYYVFSLLDKMKGKRLHLTGEGSWVTGFASTDDNTVSILLSNFDQRGSHIETVPVTIEGLNPGSYTYSEYELLGRDIIRTETIEEHTLKSSVYMPEQSVILIQITKK